MLVQSTSWIDMRYEQAQHLNDEDFRRLTGVKKPTFNHMIDILKEADKQKKAKGGRKKKLTMEDQLMMAFEYLREYRTYFHIAKSFGVSESSAFYTIKWIECILAEHKDFALPGRSALSSDAEYDVIMIDATETPIQRPKKNSGITIQEKRKDIH